MRLNRRCFMGCEWVLCVTKSIGRLHCLTNGVSKALMHWLYFSVNHFLPVRCIHLYGRVLGLPQTTYGFGLNQWSQPAIAMRRELSIFVLNDVSLSEAKNLKHNTDSRKKKQSIYNTWLSNDTCTVLSDECAKGTYWLWYSWPLFGLVTLFQVGCCCWPYMLVEWPSASMTNEQVAGLWLIRWMD